MVFSKHEASKRKSESEVGFRAFNEEWEEQFIFTMGKSSKPICLICNLTVAVPQIYNIERHLKQNHDTFNTSYPRASALRTKYISKKREALIASKTCF
jgi:hypothetical protein